MLWLATDNRKGNFLIKANSLTEAVERYNVKMAVNPKLHPLSIVQPTASFTEESIML